MNEKCRKNRSFTPDGLKELQALHHRVGVCLEQLAVILAEKDLEKRRALCNTLNNEREMPSAERNASIGTIVN